MQDTYGATPDGGDHRPSIRTIAAGAAFVANVEADGIKEHGRNLTIRRSVTAEVRRVHELVGLPDLALGSGAEVDDDGGPPDKGALEIR
jgi:hypothetical protein